MGLGDQQPAGIVRETMIEINPFARKDLWDILIVLDACRYDAFERVNWLEGELTKRKGFSSSTGEWIQTLVKYDLSDTICISANPFLSTIHLGTTGLKSPFYELLDAWDWGWDDGLGTAPPHEVTSAALEMIATKPELEMMKLYLHYIQPHNPYIGDPGLKTVGLCGTVMKYKKDGVVTDKKLPGCYDALRSGQITKEYFTAVYDANLRRVLTSVEDMVRLREKRKIITSDHGDCFGEHGIYGHPNDEKVPELLEVPWFVLK